MIDLNPRHLATVERILAEHAPGLEVRAFGSRATWTAREYSDLDLAIVGESRLDTNMIWRLKEAFSESDLPIRVDVLDWHAISDKFREAIGPDCVELVAAANEPSTARLADVATIVMGQSPPGSTYNEDGIGLPFFQGVKDFNYRHPTPRVYCSEPSRIAQPGDILFSVRAPIGRVNIADRECATGRGVAIIKPRAESDARYLEFALRHLEQSWGAIEGSGSVFGNATKRDLESLLLPWPESESERGRIAGVLGCLDDKIELNRRMAATLEEMARALFRSWFVDFEPVRAKQEGRWRSGESLPGLPAQLYETFPDRLEPSALGPIPAGWRIAALGDCFELTMGQSPPGSTYNEDGDGLPFFQGRADFGFRYPENRKFCIAPTRRAQPADTLVSVRAPVGDINMAWEECCIGRGVAALRHKSGSTSFTYYAAQTLQPALRAYESEGTVFGAITKRQFEALPVLEPPVELVDAFDVEACRMDARLAVATAEAAHLAALRDQLLRHLLIA